MVSAHPTAGQEVRTGATINIESERRALADATVPESAAADPLRQEPARVVLQHERHAVGPAAPLICVDERRIEATSRDRRLVPGSFRFRVLAIGQSERIAHRLEPVGRGPGATHLRGGHRPLNCPSTLVRPVIGRRAACQIIQRPVSLQSFLVTGERSPHRLLNVCAAQRLVPQAQLAHLARIQRVSPVALADEVAGPNHV